MATLVPNLSIVLSGYVSVKDYGAAGNGTTDDTAAIQSAINAVSAAGGGFVFFPRGDYLVSQNGSNGYCLWLPSFVNLVGCGAYSRIMTGDTTADTVRVRLTATSLAGYVEYWSIRDLHFNPAVGDSRATTANEIAVGMTRQGLIDNVGFGRRIAMATGESAPITSEESRVGTCISLGNSSAPDISAVVKILNCRYFGCYQFLNCQNIVDVYLDNIFGDCNLATAQPLYLTGHVEAWNACNCDFVNSQGGSVSTGGALLIDSALVRFSKMTQCYLDTEYNGLYATNGNDFTFANCWFSCRPGVGAYVGGSAQNFTFIGCNFVNNGSAGLHLAAGGRHLVQGCSFYTNGTSVTSGQAHVLIDGSVTSARVLANSFATNGSGLTGGGTLPAILIASGANKIRVEQNDSGGLAITNNAGSGATVQNND